MTPGDISRGELEAAAIAAEFAANATTAEEEMRAVTMLLRHDRALKLGLMKARLQQFTNPAPKHERLPLMDEGHEFGRVEARVPEELFWGLYFQKDFGPDGFYSDEGIRDLNRDYPVCRTKTVSGKATSGWTPASQSGKRSPRPDRRAESGKVHFGPGTFVPAK